MDKLQPPFSEKPRAMSQLSSTRPGSTPEPAKRRGSSISSPQGPWARRNSFLSRDMLLDENFSVYESHSIFTSNGYTKYSVISLRESQGFVFNQDLFASPYQQSRSLLTEKKYHKSRSPSVGSSVSPACSRRRHTSYNETRPTFLKGREEGDEAMEVDDEDEDDHQQGHDHDHEQEADTMESSSDDSDDYEDSTNNSVYRVKVTDIILDEEDTMIYPT